MQLGLSIYCLIRASWSFEWMVNTCYNEIQKMNENPQYRVSFHGIPDPLGLILVLVFGTVLLLQSLLFIFLYSWMIHKSKRENHLLVVLRYIGHCIGICINVRTTEYAIVGSWLLIHLMETFNIIVQMILAVSLYCYIFPTDGFITLGICASHMILELYGWSLTKLLYARNENYHNDLGIALMPRMTSTA